MKKKDYLKIGKKNFISRLIVGTGKYKNMNECAKAIKISGADMVTVAVRRVNIVDKNKTSVDFIKTKHTDKDGNYLETTKRRANILRKELAKKKKLKIHYNNKKITIKPEDITYKTTANSSRIYV